MSQYDNFPAENRQLVIPTLHGSMNWATTIMKKCCFKYRAEYRSMHRCNLVPGGVPLSGAFYAQYPDAKMNASETMRKRFWENLHETGQGGGNGPCRVVIG